MNTPEPRASEQPAERVLEVPADLDPIQPPPDLADQLAFIDIELEEHEAKTLGRYLAMLLWVNQRMNLTAIRDPHEAWTRHIADSLTLLPFIASADGDRVIDIGSGGGLPGIPLAIAMPGTKFTLLEATGKKARFLEQVARLLDLANVRVVCDRAETAGRDRQQFREQFDVAIARAVGPLPVLLELTAPFVREHGVVLAVKGERAMEEVDQAREALHTLHCHFVDCQSTPTGRIVIIEKQRATPKMYPRLPGEPKRAPIGGTQR